MFRRKPHPCVDLAQRPVSVVMDGRVYPLAEIRYHAREVMLTEYQTEPEKGLAKTVVALVDLIESWR